MTMRILFSGIGSSPSRAASRKHLFAALRLRRDSDLKPDCVGPFSPRPASEDRAGLVFQPGDALFAATRLSKGVDPFRAEVSDYRLPFLPVGRPAMAFPHFPGRTGNRPNCS
jgi:hypothetical protein